METRSPPPARQLRSATPLSPARSPPPFLSAPRPGARWRPCSPCAILVTALGALFAGQSTADAFDHAWTPR